MGLSAQQTNLSSVTKTAQLEEFTRKWEDGAVKSDALDSTITNNKFVETKDSATSSTAANAKTEDSLTSSTTTLNNTEDLKKFDAVTSGSSTVANDAKDGSIYSGWFYNSSTKTLDGASITTMSLKTADAKKTIDYTTGVKTADASAEELVRINPVNSRMATDAKGATVAELTGGTYKADGTLTADLKGDVYTSSPPYASTATESTWKGARIDALTATVTAWSSSNSDFTVITDMAGKVTNDVATLCTADISADMFSCLR